MLQIAYRLSFASARLHLLDVAVEITGLTEPFLELAMAAWAPGSYLIRDYARHVLKPRATDDQGVICPVTKTRKNRWRIEACGESLRVTYQVYCREPTVRTNFVDDEVAVLHGAPTYLWPVTDQLVAYRVVVSVNQPEDQVYTTLVPSHTESEVAYLASDLDALIDTPILVGQPLTVDFEVDGLAHQVIVAGDARFFDMRRVGQDAQKIVAAHRAFWGKLPYSRYLFLVFLGDGRSGLEHKDSCVLMASPYTTQTRESYVDWLTLVSHEHFHVWNIKRLRPIALGPFDYERESPTPSLWISEGLTAYYDALQVRRAGLMTEAEYLGEVAVPIRNLALTYGRHVQTLGESSFDAWIKLYRPDENTKNSSISYYGKGAVVGFLLDALIRQKTQSEKSLDDVMRLAFARFSGPHGFTELQFRQVAAEVVGDDLTSFFDRAVDTTSPLEDAAAFSFYGLVWSASSDATPPQPSLGLATRVDGGRHYCAEVRRDGPAAQGGLQVDDEILAIGGLRVEAATLASRLSLFRPGQKLEVHVARRGRLVMRQVIVEAKVLPLGVLGVSATATPAQNAARNAWQSAS